MLLNIYRLKKASYSLKTTDYSITEVAMNNGFQNTSYFTQQFKKMFKDTPSDYRIHNS
ncbi:helix-turn-helix domain-containing protein [Oenococcus oeni]|uniref:helix-turn-helix domain-containing protein n=1 Tax=Oenococcus oeni TaxID=1247 RepID=UPI001645021D